MPAPGERPPFCPGEAERLARSASPGTGKRYGLQRVCRIFGLARSTAYYLKARGATPPDQRPVPRKRGPVGAGTDEELVGPIRRVLAESPFVGEGYRKVWARLRHQGIRTAAERVRRLMRVKRGAARAKVRDSVVPRTDRESKGRGSWTQGPSEE